MFEGFLKQSALSLDRDDAVVHRRRDVFRDFHLQARVNGLHFLSLVPSPVILFIILQKNKSVGIKMSFVSFYTDRNGPEKRTRVNIFSSKIHL